MPTEKLQEMRLQIDGETAAKVGKLERRLDEAMDEVRKEMKATIDQRESLDGQGTQGARRRLRQHSAPMDGTRRRSSSEDGHMHRRRCRSSRTRASASVMTKTGVQSSDHLRPYCLPRSSICKVKCNISHAMARILFDVQREMGNLCWSDGYDAKTWAAADGPPEVGHERCALRSAAEDVCTWNTHLAPPEIHYGVAETSMGGKIILRRVGDGRADGGSFAGAGTGHHVLRQIPPRRGTARGARDACATSCESGSRVELADFREELEEKQHEIGQAPAGEAIIPSSWAV